MHQGGFRSSGGTFVFCFALIASMSSFVSGRLVVNGISRHHLAAFGSRPSLVGLVNKSSSSMTIRPARRDVGFKLAHQAKASNQRPNGTPLFFSFATNGGPTNSGEREHDYDWDTILPFQKNHHNSVKIEVPFHDEECGEDNLFNLDTFHSKLEATMATARQLNKTAIWITIPISRARLMEETAKLGFEFHHAEGHVATLSKWLVEKEGSRIPTYATHQVGVGAVVINPSTDEILCVREKRNNFRPWKVPGGLAELGEDLDEAVVREVYEETGIRCRFISVMGVRHVHGVQFGRSDLFFVCRLEPTPNEDGRVPQPIPQEGEIETASWLPLDEYCSMVNSDDSKIGHPMMKLIMKLADQGKENDMQRMVVSSVNPGRKPSPVYHVPILNNLK